MARAGRTCLLPGSAQQFACGVIAKPLINNFNQAVKTGFVTIILVNRQKGAKKITVGNQSSPFYQNKTFVKSFSFGGNNDASAQFVLYDASGNDIGIFLESLYLDSCTAVNNTVLIEFGWILQNTDGTVTKYSTADKTFAPYAKLDPKAKPNPGGLLGFVVDRIEVNPDAGGGWLYTVYLSTLLDKRNKRAKLATPAGTNNHPENLKNAAKKALKRICPKGTRQSSGVVLFAREENTGILTEFGFPNNEGGFRGPRSVWDPNRLSCVGAVRNWFNGQRTDRGLGMTIYTDPAIDAPNIVVLEADPSFCINPRVKYCPQKSGPKYIYIVNGGDCSPVLSFNPKVTYFANAKAQGGGTGAMSSKAVQAEARKNNPCPPNINDPFGAVEASAEGIQTLVTVPSAAMNYRFPTDAVDKQAIALNANLIANAGRIMTSNIEADLTIQGNPEFVNLARCQGLQIGIIYFNVPAVYAGQQPGIQGPPQPDQIDWLAQPNVNNTFSRLDYLIQGVTHNIQENGDYITTLRVMAIPQWAQKKKGTKNN